MFFASQFHGDCVINNTQTSNHLAQYAYMPRSKEKSPHILNAASNLVGFCIVALTSLKILSPQKRTVIDKVLVVAIGCFIASILFSFLSIRSNDERGNRYGRIADYIFLVSIFSLSLAVILIFFDFIK